LRKGQTEVLVVGRKKVWSLADDCISHEEDSRLEGDETRRVSRTFWKKKN